MKRVLSYVLLLSMLLSCAMLAGCDMFQKLTDPEAPEEPAYTLKFTSYGDGTCYVSEIITRPNVMEPYTVEIPETAPNGDRVVAIDPREVLQNTACRNVPNWILASDFEALCDTAKANGMPDFDYVKMTSFYIKMSVTGLEEPERSQLIEVFPLAEFTDFYVLDSSASQQDRAKLSEYMSRYAEFDEQDMYAAAQSLLQIQEAHMPNAPVANEYQYTAFMEKLVLPASVKLINLPTSAFGEISYAGTLAEWEAVDARLCGLLGTQIVCSDGESTFKQAYIVEEGAVLLSCDLSEPVTVKIPDYLNGQPVTSYEVALGGSTVPSKYLMSVEDFEAFLGEMGQQGLADKAEEYRAEMRVSRVGSVQYVQVYVARSLADKLTLPKDYFSSASMRVCEQTRITEDLTVANSEYFTGLELPATLQYLTLSIEDFDNLYLRDVYYPGTLEQWAQVSVRQGENTPFDLSHITVHCTDGDVALSITQ